MQGAVITLSAVFGLIVGSFLNVVIWRVPRHLSIVRPGSQCPTCETPIRPADNVPLASWIWLRGRCRHCRTPISARYPIVEVGCGVLFAAAAARFGWSGELPGYLVLFAALLAISLIDLEHHMVPVRLSVLLMAASVPLLGVAALVEGDETAFGRALLGGLAALGVLFTLNRLRFLGTGSGHVRLAASIGLYLGWLGWGEVALWLCLALLLGGIARLPSIAVKLRGGNDFVAFGPLLAAGTVIAVLWGDPIFRWYPS